MKSENSIITCAVTDCEYIGNLKKGETCPKCGNIANIVSPDYYKKLVKIKKNEPLNIEKTSNIQKKPMRKKVKRRKNMPYYTCPHCMENHDITVEECPQKKIKLPKKYIEAWKKKEPVIFMLAIGITAHGKTTYLSSLLNCLLSGEIAKRWPGFAFLSLDHKGIVRIKNEYVKPLNEGYLPAPSPIMFPEPLMIRFQKMPVIEKRMMGDRVKQKDVTFVIYDVGGETFTEDRKIIKNLPILKKIKNLIFLVSLPDLLKTQTGHIELHELLNSILNSLEHDTKGGNALVAFTKADLMWNNLNDPQNHNDVTYGPLSIKRNLEIPEVNQFKIKKYIENINLFSKRIEDHLRDDRYGGFVNNLDNNFNSYKFTTVSALGDAPDKNNEIASLEPNQLVVPLIWMMNFDKHL